MNSKIVVESIYMMQFIKKKYYTPVESVQKNVPLGDHAFHLAMSLNTLPRISQF